MDDVDMLVPAHPNCRCSVKYIYEHKDFDVKTEPTEEVETETTTSTNSPFPEKVRKNIDQFAEDTALANREHMFVTASDGSIGPINRGSGRTVGISDEQKEWISKKRAEGLEVYASHNHPNLAQTRRYDTLTFLSEEDCEIFMNPGKWGDNLITSFSAEGPKNRMTIYDNTASENLSFKDRDDLQLKQSYKMDEAYQCLFDYDRKVNRGLKPSTKFLTQKKEELREQGIEWRKNPEALKKYEEEAKALDENYAEIEFEKTIEKMNEILNPVGLGVTNEMRHLNKLQGKYLKPL